MAAWTKNELDKIESTEEIQISSLRSDSALRKPVTIWIVRLGDDLYVRSVNGRDGAWFRSTQVRHEGHVRAGSIEKDVSFEEADPKINDQVDTAYRTKYRRYAANIVNSILTSQARDATIKLVPR